MTISFRGGDLYAMLFGGIIESVESPTAPTVTGTPTELDTEMLEAVDEIIEELGKTVTFWLYGSQTYDPETGKRTTGDATQYNKKVIPPYEVALRYVDGDLIHAGDLLTGVPAKDIEFTPEKGTKVTIGSDVWVIVRVSPIYSGERIALYLLQLRR